MVVTAKPRFGSGDGVLPVQTINASTSFTPASFSGANISLGQSIEIALSEVPTAGKSYSFYVESSGDYTLTFSSDFDLGDIEYNHVFSPNDTAVLEFVGSGSKLLLVSASRGD